MPSITATGSTGFCQGNSIDLDAHSDYVNQRWASEVIAYSTQYDYPDWAAIQILGEPDVYPGYGDIELSWSPAGQDEPSQFLELGFSYPIPINFVDIFETFGPGTVDSIYVMNPGTGLYELVYSDVPEVCGDSAFVLHATFPMTSFPVSQIRIHMDMSAVPGWNDFDAVRIGSDVPAGYTWSTGDTSSTINVSSTGSFTVSVTNSLGCTSVSPQVDVVVYPTPVVSAGPDIYTGSCSGVIALNNASPSGGSFSGSGVSGNEFDASIGAGNYTLEYFYTDSNGCSASDEMEMTIVDAPVVTLTAFDNVCADAPAFALTGGLPAGGVYTGNGVTNGVFDPSIGAGSYTITYSYQDSLGCGGSASQSFTVDVCMGIYNADDNSMISYYPNPAGEHVTFDLSQAGKVSTVEIFSSAGAKLYHRQISEQGESHLLEADLSNLPAGAYTVRVVSDKGVFNKKLMKQK
ncbi:MAG: T9SS type A sorting domain-containing protein [Bacteroidia bacterium]